MIIPIWRPLPATAPRAGPGPRGHLGPRIRPVQPVEPTVRGRNLNAPSGLSRGRNRNERNETERNGTHRVGSGHGWKRPCRGTGAFVNKRLIQPVSVIAIRRLFIKERLYFQCIACLLKNGFIFNVSIVWNVSHGEINTRQVVQSPIGRLFIK